jgi:hypothetical protein
LGAHELHADVFFVDDTIYITSGLSFEGQVLALVPLEKIGAVHTFQGSSFCVLVPVYFQLL